jgi:catechol 2,3-dioxygenase-like lactoylglutathione lyase family enzyme
MLTHIQIVNVPVADQSAAYEFYVERLGLAVIADVDGGPHGRWLQVGPTGSATSLALTPAADAGRLGGLVLQTDDIEADVATLTERGIRFEHGIEDMPWARAARFTDQDGNQLALQTAPAQ